MNSSSLLYRSVCFEQLQLSMYLPPLPLQSREAAIFGSLHPYRSRRKHVCQVTIAPPRGKHSPEIVTCSKSHTSFQVQPPPTNSPVCVGFRDPAGNWPKGPRELFGLRSFHLKRLSKALSART